MGLLLNWLLLIGYSIAFGFTTTYFAVLVGGLAHERDGFATMMGTVVGTVCAPLSLIFGTLLVLKVIEVFGR